MPEKIRCQILYEANGNPTCKIVVNGLCVHQFVGSGNKETFDFEVGEGPFSLRIVHYGKNMKKDLDRFIEIKKIFLNDVDLKNKIWETTQVAEVPVWQDASSFKWEANLYFGHNGYIEYEMESPIFNFLHEYHTFGAKVSSNMGSYDMKLLYEMKEYFSKIVKEQDEESQ